MLLLELAISRCFFFQAEDGIRDLVRSRGLGDVYKRQMLRWMEERLRQVAAEHPAEAHKKFSTWAPSKAESCLLYTSDAADERSSVDLGGRRIIKKKNTTDARTSTERHQEEE